MPRALLSGRFQEYFDKYKSIVIKKSIILTPIFKNNASDEFLKIDYAGDFIQLGYLVMLQLDFTRTFAKSIE